MPNLLLDRYVNGQHQEVWGDLVALGAAVRNDFYYNDAKAVTDETMRRARHNVEEILTKLDSLGYKYASPEDHLPPVSHMMDPFKAVEASMKRMPPMAGLPNIPGFDPSEAMRQNLERMKAAREPGFVPRNPMEEMMARMSKDMETMREQMAVRAPKLAEMRAAMEASSQKLKGKPAIENPRVFQPPTKKTLKELKKLENEIEGDLPLSLRSWHEFVGGVNLDGTHESIAPGGAENLSDPLMVVPLDQAEEYEEAMGGGGEDSEDSEFEGREILLWAAEGDAFLMKIPDPAADALVLGFHRTFVEHLRKCFAWGGFPGWERASEYPKEIDHLREGLLPL